MARQSSFQRRLARARSAAASCRNCDLWEPATQTVFGEGNPKARIMLVGEQPGDREDRVGQPFVGPAGKMLDRALEDAGINRTTVYVTNAVKHFRFEERGKRRIHKKPNAGQIAACHPWLEEEIEIIRPELIVCLGATAAQSLLGSRFRLTQHRGEVLQAEDLPPVTATVHPSALLRLRGEERETEFARFVADLKAASRSIDSHRRAG
jgi:uracil-DNA glycosylase family protein